MEDVVVEEENTDEYGVNNVDDVDIHSPPLVVDNIYKNDEYDGFLNIKSSCLILD